MSKYMAGYIFNKSYFLHFYNYLCQCTLEYFVSGQTNPGALLSEHRVKNFVVDFFLYDNKKNNDLQSWVNE